MDADGAIGRRIAKDDRIFQKNYGRIEPMIKYSFIIPVKEINHYIRESVPKILAIGRDDYEIIIYPDHASGKTWQKTKQIASGPGGPAMKRTLAIRDAQGDILVFMDDDAYPAKNFLELLDDVFSDLGGFDTAYWPGEDTKFCLDLLEKKGKKILYDPRLIAWHHRREGFVRHMRQVGGYGIHRGFFARVYPATSFRLKYFIPSAFLVYIIAGLGIGIRHPFLLQYYIVGLVIYMIALSKALYDIARHEKDRRILFHAAYYIFFTHLVYGYKFIVGFFFTKNLKSKLR